MSSLWQALRRPPVAVSAAFLLALTLACAAPPLIAAFTGADAHHVDLGGRLGSPSLAHPLGTDELGRDLLLRLLDAGRVSLSIGVLGALAAALIGTAIGLAVGRGGPFGRALQRLADAVGALPTLPLLMTVVATGLPWLLTRSEVGMMVVLVALFGWVAAARPIGEATRSLATPRLVAVFDAAGAPAPRVTVLRFLAELAVPVVVASILLIGPTILLESVLSFFEFGVDPLVESWGGMTRAFAELMFFHPLVAVSPSLLIFATVLAWNTLGDGLQSALLPQRERADDAPASLPRGGMAIASFVLVRLRRLAVATAFLSFTIFLLVALIPGERFARPRLPGTPHSALAREAPAPRPGYLVWAEAALGGDFGTSQLYREPVTDLILPKLGNTLLVMATSLGLALPIALPLARAAARRPGGALAAVATVLSLVSLSIPLFWLALAMLFAFGLGPHWLAVGALLALATIGGHIRFLRDATRAALRRDLIHASRVSTAVALTIGLIARSFGSLFSAALIVDAILPDSGLGMLIYAAIRGDDLNLAVGALLLVSVLALLLRLVADVVAALDARGLAAP